MVPHFVVGRHYSRQDVYSVVGVPTEKQGGDWDTGYHEHDGAFFVFCNVGVAGRTGHDYGNYFDGDELCWFAKNRSQLRQAQIQRLLTPGAVVLVFFRSNDREPFEFAGQASPKETRDATEGRPVFVRWCFPNRGESHPEREAQEVLDPASFPEGALKRVYVNKYERNPAARSRCIQVHGLDCVVCGFNFERVYGSLGAGFIHVHHLTPLAVTGPGSCVEPEHDLRPVCANCHSMIHRTSVAMTIEQLRTIVRDTSTRSSEVSDRGGPATRI